MRHVLLFAFVLTFINAHAQLSVTANVMDDACGTCSGCITWGATGGTAPYAYTWSPTPATGQGTNHACGLCAGTWSVTVTDSNGDDVTASATVGTTTELLVPSSSSNPPGHSCNAACTGNWTSAGPLGGTAPYTVSVSNGGTGSATAYYAQLSGLCPGTTYDATITDANGCSSTFSNINVLDGTTPQVVSQTMNGACLGLQQGTAVLTFDQPVVQAVLYSGQANFSWSGNVLTISGLAPSTIVLAVTGTDAWCPAQVVLDITQDPAVCGTLNGRVFADLDGNCTQDPSDPGIPYHVLVAQPGNRAMVTNAQGDYEVGLVYGSFTLDNAGTDYSADCLVPFPTPFTLSTGSPVATIDVAETPLLGADVRAFLSASVHRPGWSTYYTVQARNNTPFEMQNVAMELSYDPLLGFNSATGSPTSSGAGIVQWTIPVLAPFSSTMYWVSLHVPPDPLLLGTVVNSTLTLTPQTPDSDPGNDVYSISKTITNSYDPNDKRSITSSRSSEETYFLDLDTYVDHTVRFQNTGTADAIDVYILDTISDRYDLTSFQLLGASHNMVPSIQEDRTLRFDFPNIMLPDSGANEAASHGFVSYRLKPTNDLAVSDVLRNTADIFFDINPAVRTNTTELTAEFSVGIPEREGLPLLLAPNPSSSHVRVTTPGAGTLVEICSIDGRILQQAKTSSASFDLDVRPFAPGTYIVRATAPSGNVQVARFIRQ